MKPDTYPLGEYERRAFSQAIQAAQLLRKQGTRHPYGLYPNKPLTAAQRRHVGVLERAASRLFEIDREASR